mmetsp:Transcript_32734/g.74835  ORF Transcript_32734/g.74835 Transcript_32734/m.74835 type:complete len:131 (-) Transcript_32734:95-487(-)
MGFIQKVTFTSFLVSLALAPVALASPQILAQWFPEKFVSLELDSLDDPFCISNATGMETLEDLAAKWYLTVSVDASMFASKSLPGDIAQEAVLDEDEDGWLPTPVQHAVCWLCYFSLFYFYKDVNALGGL